MTDISFQFYIDAGLSKIQRSDRAECRL